MSGLVFGGSVDPKGQTEDWNGGSWSEVADLNSGRNDMAGGGADNTSAIAFGGTPPVGGLTEEWNGSSTTIKVLTD